MRMKIEMAGTGNVHGHVLHYGSFAPKEKLEVVIRQVGGLPRGVRHGFTWIELAKTDEKALAAEASKYVTKSSSPQCEDWLAGEEREVMHPTLAARWELATMGRTLSRTYGALRGVAAEEEEKEDERQREEKAACPDHCEHCGVIGEMAIVTVETEPTIAAMHANGMRALAGSRWKPRPKESPPPILTDVSRQHDGDVVLLSFRDRRDPFDVGTITVVPRADAIGGYLAALGDIVSMDMIATLRHRAAAGATWVLLIERKRRVRVRVQQIVFASAA
jgi:hypothetical protein